MNPIDGRAVADDPVYTAQGWLLELAPAARKRLIYDSIDVLARIHQVDWQEIGLSYLDMTEYGSRGPEQLRNRTLRWFRWAVPEENRVLEQPWRWLDEHWPHSADVTLRWVMPGPPICSTTTMG